MASTSWAIHPWTAYDRRPIRADRLGRYRFSRKIFVCNPSKGKPTVPADEAGSTRQLLSSLARVAYRRPADKMTVDTLMDF